MPELPRREPYRTWPGGLIVLAVIVGYVSLWVGLDDTIEPDLQPIPAGSVQQVGPAVSFVPVAGWYLDATDSSQSDSTSSVLLVGKTGQFNVQVLPWEGTLAEEVKRQKDTDEAFGEARVIDNDATFTTAGGLSGTTFSFFNQEDQGRVWVSVDETADRAIVMVGRSPDSAFDQGLPEYQAMIDSIRTEQS
ncbi:hypothetical protein [Actinoplanes sp. DH11]|uniref:hypothetical protein n=1 Tax=Actinoplanes sp. DH11 TaxID=2857011 RepID=UPI001E4A3968|nr:hypothetical protein [Actinoplanes sp. DH11]